MGRVLPCPWNDRYRFQETCRFLDQSYESVLSRLTSHLASFHGQPPDERYWRIILGPWLVHYLHVLYDRYVHLEQAFHEIPDVTTTILAAESHRTPVDAGQFVGWIEDDHHNLQLISQLLEATGRNFPARALKAVEFPLASPTIRRRVTAAVDAAQRALSLVAARAGGSHCRMALADMYVGRSALWGLSARMGGRALPLDFPKAWPFQACEATDTGARARLAQLEAKDEFEQIVFRTLPRNFPTLYLEQFQDARRATLSSRAAPIVVSSAGWHFNEPFKFYAAESQRRGSRLIGIQHGGGYGMARVLPTEKHELRVTDKYGVWGWAADEKHLNLASPRLTTAPTTERKADSRVGIELVGTAHPRYLYRFQSAPVGSQWEEYFSWQDRFLGELPHYLHGLTWMRPYPVDYGHAYKARLAAREWLQWDEGGRLVERLAGRRLVVIDHCMTSLLEVIAVDYPTVLFWDPSRWELRPDAERVAEALRAAGVLFDTPEGAAKHVAEVYEEPEQWWRGKPVRAARAQLLDRFGWVAPDWRGQWSRALQQGLQRRAG